MVLAGHLTVDDAYAAVSGAARTVLGIPDVRIAPGCAADLLAVRAGSLREAIAFAPNGPDDQTRVPSRSFVSDGAAGPDQSSEAPFTGSSNVAISRNALSNASTAPSNKAAPRSTEAMVGSPM